MYKNSKFFFLGAISALILSGCSSLAQPTEQSASPKNLDQDLISMVEKKKGSNEKISFKVRSLTNFEWEKMYVFAPYTPTAEINRALGFNWEDASGTGIDRRDDITLLVFANGGKVVDRVLYPRGRGDFSAIKKDNGFTPDEANFVVTEVLIDKSGTSQLIVKPEVN